MAQQFPPSAQPIIKARSKADEDEIIAEAQRRGWAWEQLDKPTNKRKRPEGCVLIGGQRAVIVEAKRAESGGRSTDGTVMLSDLDPDLATTAGVKVFPAIPPRVDPQLDHAQAKYRELTADEPVFDGLPYVVVYTCNAMASLDHVDRRQPMRREISGFIYPLRGRRRQEALNGMTLDELGRRIDERDESGLPAADELEWRYVANPLALRAVPEAFRATCIVGWPNEIAWPECLPPSEEARVRSAVAALPIDQRRVLEAMHWICGRVDVAQREFAPAADVVRALTARGLARQTVGTTFELTTEGIRYGLVMELDATP